MHAYIYLPLPAVGYCTKQSRWVISTYCTSPHFDRSTPRSKVVKFHLSSRHLIIHIGTSEQSRLLLSEMTICHSSPGVCCNSRCCANSELKKKKKARSKARSMIILIIFRFRNFPNRTRTNRMWPLPTTTGRCNTNVIQHSTALL